jgi:hypothetical protein
METVTSPPEVAEAVLFRPAKKRKIYRQRALDDVPSPTPSPTGATETLDAIVAPVSAENASPIGEDLEGTRVSMSEILRLRKLRKHRVGGVEFRASTVNEREDDGQDGALVLNESRRADDEKDEIPQGLGVPRKFAKQTGMVGDVDKHM